MIVVSDTTPLNYLILIGQIDLLPRLYGQVIVPATVAHELQHLRAPASVGVDWKPTSLAGDSRRRHH